MAVADGSQVRNAGIVGHSGTGKTSLIEHILHAAGEIGRVGTIKEGNTVGDYLEEEREHQHTITMKLMHANWNGTRVHLIDHPGYPDFVGDLAASTSLLDGIVIMVDGITGPQVGTDNAMKYADMHNVPRILFVNKLDRDDSNFETVLDQLRGAYGANCMPLVVPTFAQDHLEGVINLTAEEASDLVAQAEEFKSAIIDTVAESDDELLETYLEEGTLSQEQIDLGLRNGIGSGKIVPVIAGSVEEDKGVSELLDIIVNYFPSPLDREMQAHNGSDSEVTIKATDDGPFLGQVFRSVSDPYVGQLTLFRVLSGRLKADSEFYNTTSQSKERAGKIFLLNGKEQTAVPEVGPGDIAALTKLKHTHFGDTLAKVGTQIELPKIEMPDAMVKLALVPKTRSDEDKIGEALNRVSEEDPTVHHYRDDQTKEYILRGVGDLQLDLLLERLKRDYNVEAETHTPKVAYKMTIRGKADVQGKYKKQTGGHGQYGDVHLRLSPNPRGEGYSFQDSIVGGVVPRQYIPHVDKGAQDTLSTGTVPGMPIVDVNVELHFGSYHNVDSSEMAFKVATSMAIKKGIQEADPYILEPVVEIEVTTPEAYMGDCIGDLTSRRGRILDSGSGGADRQIIRANVPEAEVLKYSADLRSMTHGRGTYALKFSHFDEVPAEIAKDIIAEYEKKDD